MTTTDKIRDKEEKIKVSQEKIKAEQEKIKKWSEEIEVLKTMEIKGLLKEIDIPFDDLKKALSVLKEGKSIPDIECNTKEAVQEDPQE